MQIHNLEFKINENRWAKNLKKVKLTKNQQDLLNRLNRTRTVCRNKKLKEQETAIKAILEFLPHCPTLAVMFAEIYKLTPETIQEIRTVFNVAGKIENDSSLN